jgi:hypothetical protein
MGAVARLLAWTLVLYHWVAEEGKMVDRMAM